MLFVATQVPSRHGKIFSYHPCNIHFPNGPVYQQASYIEINNILWLQAIKTRE